MRKKLFFCAGGFIIVVASIYAGGVGYFSGHFFPGTRIGNIDISLNSADEAEQYLENLCAEYRLSILYPSAGKEETEIIQGADISLTVSEKDTVQELLKGQNNFLWPVSLVRGEDFVRIPDLEFDEIKLREKIGGLDFVELGKNGPVSSMPLFDGEKFIPDQEVYGVSEEEISESIIQCIRQLQPEFDAGGLMEKPEYFHDSEKVIHACDELNKYCSARITYRLDREITVDSRLISEWVICDDNLNTGLDEDKIREWIGSLAAEYNTAGKERTFTASSGETAVVSGGTYGWIIDEESEASALIENVKNGQTVEREPACIQRAAVYGSPDWGAEYVEVDLTRQHMWYLKDGAVLLETDVVTGKPEEGMATPEGVYSVLYTQKDAVLVGEADPQTGEPLYRQHVDYWMPFTQQGHGFHDADWQWSFGGDMYQENGSHGCVNMPVDKAGELYDIISAGIPVIIHR